MEVILHKNIFNEQYLRQLSPDYTPTAPLRMEMRRNLVNGSHGIGSGVGGDGFLKSGSWQRKSIKKSKDSYTFNKEIIKIRNNFQIVNLKNKLLLKYVNSVKPKKAFTNNEKILIKGNQNEIEDESNFYIKEITDDLNNLVINCDSDFKINNKTKPCKPDKKKYQNCERMKIKNNLQQRPMDKDDEFINTDVLRIECTYINESLKVEVDDEPDNSLNEKEEIKTDLQISSTETNYLGNDLQSLLVMMGLSPKSNKSEERHDSNRSGDSYNGNHIEVTEETNDLPPAAIPNSNRSKLSEDMTNYLCVAPMRIKISSREETLLRKYVEKWRNFVAYKKDIILQQRQATLDSFFDKLAKKKMQIKDFHESTQKAKVLAQDFNTYQRRYKVQKHIIALQRAKLEEQNRVIEELKYNKILEASRESVDAMREEVRKSYHELDRQLKPKIKLLTNELKLQNIEEPSLILHCLKVPQFLQRMEKRAREREEKHAMIRERRRQIEEERIRLKQQAELAKAEMDKEEKMKRIKELRQKRKKEKIESIRKKQFAARLRALIVMADLHYEKTLMMKYGIRPFKIILEMKRDNIEKAKAHYALQLKQNVFTHWMWHTEDMWFERNFIAEDFHRKKVLRKAFEGLKLNMRQYIIKKQVAEDYYDLYVTQMIFRRFREGIEVLKKEQEMKWNRAEAYYNSNLLFKVITCWRTLPALNALKRQQDARKARWREKVLQVVPDYTPPED